MATRKTTGDAGEAAAVVFLEAHGFRIVDVNVRPGLAEDRLPGELDIVAWDGDALCFVEVKTRTETIHSTDESPAEAVTGRKQAQIVRLAFCYALQNGLLADDAETALRFDVVAVRRTVARGVETFRCELIRAAFYPAAGD